MHFGGDITALIDHIPINMHTNLFRPSHPDMDVKNAKEQDNALKYRFFFIRSRVNQNLFSPLPWLQIARFLVVHLSC